VALVDAGPLDSKTGVILFSSMTPPRAGSRAVEYPGLSGPGPNDVRAAATAIPARSGTRYRNIIAAFVGTGHRVVSFWWSRRRGSDGQRGRSRPRDRQGRGAQVRLRRPRMHGSAASKTAIERRVRKAINKGMATSWPNGSIDEEDDSKRRARPSRGRIRPHRPERKFHRSAHYLGLAWGV